MEENLKASMANYNDDSIRTMEGMKHIRLRPGMYIGGLGNGTDPRHGIYTILKEVIDNSVDEFRHLPSPPNMREYQDARAPHHPPQDRRHSDGDRSEYNLHPILLFGVFPRVRL